MARENTSCLWHDVICLQDEQIVTFVCKTLLQLEEEKCIEELLKVEAVELGSGEIVLQGLLKTEEGENKKIEVKLPFIKEEIELGAANYFQINYLQGQLLADKLWVECVICGRIEKEQKIQQVVLGEITVRENLVLAEDFPQCERIIATHLCSTVEKMELQDGKHLILGGKHSISVLYEGMTLQGERLFIQQQDCSFEEELELSHAFDEVPTVIMPYSILTARQLTEQQINIEGTVVVRVDGVRDEMPETELFAEEGLENEANGKGRQRISSRHNLAKYMRELESIVNEEKTLRNFDLQDK